MTGGIGLRKGEIIVDNFAGGGGASTGIEMALGRSPDIAINHDPEAIAQHTINHPDTHHFCESVWTVNPKKVCAGRPVGLAWFSPDCKHFSKAKGGKPVNKQIRGLAWVAVRWAKEVRPRVIILENVEEFVTWGPVKKDTGMPCPLRKGATFRRFDRQLRDLGYVTDWQEMRADEYGVPTTRKRLFYVARCDGQDIVWPEPTHGRGLLPVRTAAECIDWSLSCPSIFLTKEEARPLGIKRPLADNTMKRIARGIKKFVIDAKSPFIVPVTHTGDDRCHSIGEPLRTVTGAKRGEFSIVTPYLAGVGGRKGQSPETPVTQPYHTITAKADTVLVSPTLIQTGYGEREGQAPRVPGLDKPLGTVVAGGQKHGLVSAFLAKHYGDSGQRPGSGMDEPVSTITASDHNALVASNIVKLKGTCKDGQAIDEPLHTVQAGGNHYAETRAFLMKYHASGGQWNSLAEPMPTVLANDSIGIVTVNGEKYVIADIGMRMLCPRELYRAQGFPDSYIIDRTEAGTPLSKEAQVRMCGNSVCPPVAAAVVTAQFAHEQINEAAA